MPPHPVRSVLGFAIAVLGVLGAIGSEVHGFHVPWAIPVATACVGTAFIVWER